LKSGCYGESGKVYFKLKKDDGRVGKKYEHLVILCIVFRHDFDEEKNNSRRTAFDFVPDVPIAEVFFYKNASEIPNRRLEPYRRRSPDDDAKYGDSRYVIGVDTQDRLNILRKNLKEALSELSIYSKEQFWFHYGPGTPNPKPNTKHVREIWNIEQLSLIVGIENLRAPKFQNECTDIIAIVEGKEVTVSLKTAYQHLECLSETYDFALGAHPRSDECELVIVFYYKKNVVTHISVLCARRVYDNGMKSFGWSQTNNTDVLKDWISVESSNVLDALYFMLVSN